MRNWHPKDLNSTCTQQTQKSLGPLFKFTLSVPPLDSHSPHINGCLSKRVGSLRPWWAHDISWPMGEWASSILKLLKMEEVTNAEHRMNLELFLPSLLHYLLQVSESEFYLSLSLSLTNINEFNMCIWWNTIKTYRIFLQIWENFPMSTGPPYDRQSIREQWYNVQRLLQLPVWVSTSVFCFILKKYNHELFAYMYGAFDCY